MRRAVRGALGLATIGTMAGMALAAEKPPAEYQNVMKGLGAAQMSLRNNLTSKSYEGVAKDAVAIKASLRAAEQFWTTRKVQDAINFAKAGLKGATDLETAANAKNDEGIAAAQKAIGGACMGCHTAHRERLPDGTFEIK